MKKLFLFVAIFVIILSLAACGADENEVQPYGESIEYEPPTQLQEPSPPEPTPSPPPSKSTPSPQPPELTPSPQLPESTPSPQQPEPEPTYTPHTHKIPPVSADTWQEAFAELLRLYLATPLRDWEEAWKFILHDINQDGIPELILVTRHITGHMEYRYAYSFANGVTVQLGFENFLTDGAIFAPMDGSPWIVAFLAAGSGGMYVKLEMVGDEIVPVIEGMAFMSQAGHDMYTTDDFDWWSYEWHDVTLNDDPVTPAEFVYVFGKWEDRIWLSPREINDENIARYFGLPGL